MSDRRADRRFLRSALHDISRNKRVRKCGRYLVDRDQGVGIAVAGDVAHFTGLQLCGSVWACPVCSAKIRNQRSQEVDAAMAQHIERGGLALFVTLTVQHGVHHRLRDTFGLVADTWRTINGGRAGKDRRETFGVLGTIRALEVTHGENGWHPHLHALVLLDHGDADLAGVLGRDLVRSWCDGIEDAGHARPSRAAQRVELVADAAGVSKYLAKVQDDHGAQMGVAMELARSDLKRGRRASRTPFEILRDFTRTGDMADVLRWWEYEEVTRRRHAITWSKGLRSRFDLEEVVDDQADADRAVEGSVAVATIPASTWSKLIRHRHAGTWVLEAVERDGLPGVRAVLASLGLPVILGVPPSDDGGEPPP